MIARMCLIFGLLAYTTAGCAQDGNSGPTGPKADVRATPSHSAIIRVNQPVENFDIDRSSIEVRVRAASTNEDEAFIVVVYEENDGLSEQLDSFTFFPSAKDGDVREFLIQAPAGLTNNDATLRFQLVSADPSQALSGTEIQILEAKLLGPSDP